MFIGAFSKTSFIFFLAPKRVKKLMSRIKMGFSGYK
jgi:hypothetical protein